MKAPPTPEEQIAWYAERAAILQYAVRHLASAWHRRHADEKLASWTNCADRLCALAHDAVEGRLEARTTTEHGRVLSIQRKEEAG